MHHQMHKLCVLTVLLFICDFASVTKSHPYDPHDHQSNPFFEGWFIRITSNSTRGPGSLAFGIGHLPDQHPSNPAAVCFIIIPPDTDALPAVLPGRPSQLHDALRSSSSSSSSDCKDRTAAPTACNTNTTAPCTFKHYFSSLDVHPSKQQALCVDCPAFVARGANGGGTCRLEVTGDLVSIEAEVPGSFKFSAYNDPATATIIPWGDSPGSSPEGWLPAGMLKLHWYVYSMATPIAYNLTLYDTMQCNAQQPESHAQQQSVEAARRGGVAMKGARVLLADDELKPGTADHHHHHHQQQQQQKDAAITTEQLSSQLTHAEQQQQQIFKEQQQQQQQPQGSAPAAAVQYSGSGFAHMEKNWGNAFPEQWVWAQGNSRDGQASFVLAGGSLPIKSPKLSSSISFLQRLKLLKLPLLKLSSPESSTSAEPGSSGDSRASSDSMFPAGQSFSHTIGQQPSTSKPNTQCSEPLAFAFSLHSAQLNLTVDPYHPGWVTAFEPCACCSSVAVKLSSWRYEVVIRLEADASSFAGLPCPTEDGFRFETVESFVAAAHVRVYGAAATPGSRTGFNTAKQQRLLLSAFAFNGAALEFGGSLRCSSSSSRHSSSTSSIEASLTKPVAT